MAQSSSIQQSYSRIAMGERSQRPADILVAATDAFCLKENPTDAEKKQYHELFCSLIGKCDAPVKRLLSPSVARCQHMPRVAMIYFALDTAAVAAPVLAYASGIENIDLEQIIDKTTIQHQRVIAGRSDLGKDLITKLINLDDVTTMRRLLSNEGITLTSAQRSMMESVINQTVKNDIELPKFDNKPLATPIEELLELAGKGGRIPRKPTAIPEAFVVPDRAARPETVRQVKVKSATPEKVNKPAVATAQQAAMPIARRNSNPARIPKPVVVSKPAAQKLAAETNSTPNSAASIGNTALKASAAPMPVAKPNRVAQPQAIAAPKVSASQPVSTPHSFAKPLANQQPKPEVANTIELEQATLPAVLQPVRDERFHLEFMAAAKSKNRGAMMKAVQNRFDINRGIAERIFSDASGDTLLITLRAARMKPQLAHQAMILAIPAIGLSVQNTARSVALYEGLKYETCKLAINNWYVADLVRRKAITNKASEQKAAVEATVAAAPVVAPDKKDNALAPAAKAEAKPDPLAARRAAIAEQRASLDAQHARLKEFAEAQAAKRMAEQKRKIADREKQAELHALHLEEEQLQRQRAELAQKRAGSSGKHAPHLYDDEHRATATRTGRVESRPTGDRAAGQRIGDMRSRFEKLRDAI